MTFKISNGFEVKPGDLDWWFDLHDSLKWRYAHTMPKVPHSYVIREKSLDAERYDKAFGVIRTFGVPGKFWNRTQLYLHNRERGIRYWLMSRKFFKSRSLNMATDGRDYGKQDAPSTFRETFEEYDAISPWWDFYYRDFEEFDSSMLWKVIHQNENLVRPSVLDIGAGTGATFEANVGPSENAVAVDPSQGMLNDLVQKFPKIGEVFPGTFEEWMQKNAPGDSGRDLVVASVGSASYFSREEIEAAPKYAKKLCLLSFYASTPVHRTDLPETHEDAIEAALELPGATAMTHGNFINIIMRGQNGDN